MIVFENPLLLSGLIGLLAALLVGGGEFLLHYSSDGYNNRLPYHFMKSLSRRRLIVGHFLAVLAAPLYLVGYWHIYKMLAPAGGVLPTLTVLVGGYGFIIGAVWIGSRALIASIIQTPKAIPSLIADYQLYSESLLQIIRITTVVMSLGFIYLVWQGTTFYPPWMAIFNPLFLLILAFLSYAWAPSVGKYVIPIAMNVAYAIFFMLSLIIAFHKVVLS